MCTLSYLVPFWAKKSQCSDENDLFLSPLSRKKIKLAIYKWQSRKEGTAQRDPCKLIDLQQLALSFPRGHSVTTATTTTTTAHTHFSHCTIDPRCAPRLLCATEVLPQKHWSVISPPVPLSPFTQLIEHELVDGRQWHMMWAVVQLRMKDWHPLSLSHPQPMAQAHVYLCKWPLIVRKSQITLQSSSCAIDFGCSLPLSALYHFTF